MTRSIGNQSIDAARLTLILNELRLPAIKQGWPVFAERADKEAWPASRFLATLAEHEVAERDRRRIERHLAEARLLPGKTLDSFDFDAVPMISKAHVMAICAGDSWIDNGAKLAERAKVELRIEFYNVFNHIQFDPDGVITDIGSGNFGKVTKVFDQRRMQLAAKVYF